MISNYIKILWKNLKNNKVYTLLNVFGLAIGISASILIALFIKDELSYDMYHKKVDRIYRLTTTMDFNGEMNTGVTNMAVGPTLKQDYPEVESYTRFYGNQQEMEIEVNKTLFKSDNLWFTDSTVFDVFSYDMVAGNPTSALKAPNSIVLTTTLAKKLFGKTNVVGEQIRLNNSMLTVQGVINDPPKNSEIPINGLISLSTLPPGFHATFNQDWFRIAVYTYVLMKKPIKPSSFKAKLEEVNKKYVLPWAEANGIKASHNYLLTPMKDVHFDNVHEYDLPKGKKSNIFIFSILAIFVLLIAAFNFINLTLAQQSKRAKEVGIRKTLGAKKSSLVFQFLTESMFITFIALILGLGLTELFIDKFNEISGKSVQIISVFSPWMLLTIFGVFALIGFLAGTYPAFILSSLKPITVLSGNKKQEGGVGLFRKGLIMLQFLFSLFMISGTFLIGDQMEFIKNKNLGFDRENLISITLPADTNARKLIRPWIEDLKTNSKIASFSRSALPTGNSGELMFRVEKEKKMVETTVKCLFVDDEFINVLNLKLLKGRNFSTDFPTDQTSAFIINETAAKKFGWNQESLNKRVQWGLLENGQAQFDGKVVGVISDFHFMSLHNPLEPLILCYSPNSGANLSVRLSKGDYTKTIDKLKSDWDKILPNYTFDYTFYDQDLEANYQDEIKMYSVFSYFSIVAILLASLGLFSLLSYSIQSRTREIGIRKVLGASLSHLSWIIVKDFLLLLCIAFVISSPIVYYLWIKWLEDYAYQTPLNIWSFILSFVLSIALSLLAVIYHSWKIAKQNPVNSIREE